jgi:putative OPT family oligopeptide transporter
MKKENFIPVVPASTNMKEFTVRALLIGLVLAVVLGAANAYLGLKSGMTIAATYPAAVIGMALLRFFKGSILEENFTRTVGSIGESVAAGAIFTLPAFYIAGIWNREEFKSMDSYITASLILIAGGLLGVLFVALLRRMMVEDKELPFPESTAAAEIHKTGQSSGGSKYLFTAMIVGALIKVVGELKLFATDWAWFFKSSIATLAGGKTLEGGFYLSGPTISPAYLGVGYIIGPRLSALNFSGLIIGWGVLVPLFLSILGTDFVNSVQVNIKNGLNATSLEGWQNAANAVRDDMVKFIAIGGMLVAACFTLYRMRNSLGTGLKRAFKDLGQATKGTSEKMERTEKDLKAAWILAGICVGAVLTFIITYFIFHTTILVAVVASTVMIILAFLFSAVSGYLVGIIGSSNNPISGLTITALVVTALLLVICGVTEDTGGVAAVLGISAIVCVAAAVAGEMFQDLKAGHILGGTPWKMQVGDIIGVVLSGCVMFGVLIILNEGDIKTGIEVGYEGGLGGPMLAAPQATLMALLAKGIVSGSMTWILVIAGMVLCTAFILMGLKSPMLIFVGMYLPFGTVCAIFVGGLIKGILDLYTAKRKYSSGQLVSVENTGILMASGLIAGEALMGLLIAVFAIFEIIFSKLLKISNPSYLIGLAIMVVLAFFLIRIPLRKATKTQS